MPKSFHVRSLIPVTVALALLGGIHVQQGDAQVVFSENFDAQEPWKSKQLPRGGGGVSWGTPTFRNSCSTYCPPAGWTSYRAAPSHWNPNPRDTYLIGSEGARGGIGKGLTYNVESTGEWGTWSGGALDKYLGAAGYPELYVRFYMKEPAEFCWGSESLNLNAMGKLLRISALRRDPTVSPSLFNPQRYPSADTSPTLIGNAYRRFQPHYGIPAQFNVEERYAPDYKHGPNTTFPATLPNDDATGGKGYCGDDKWHSYEYYVRLNSSLDKADGAYRVWLDGNTVAEKSDIAWVRSGKDKNGTRMTVSTGWNWVMLADNVDATAHPKASAVEMPRYIDDVVISTHYSGPPPTPVKVEARRRGRSGVRLKWRAGNNGASYAVDGYFVYHGKNPAKLGSKIDVGSVTEYEVALPEGGDDSFFAVSAYNRGEGGSSINESAPSTPVEP